MKKSISRAAVLCALIAGLMASGPSADDHAHQESMGKAEPTEHSIYGLDPIFTTQDGDPFTLKSLRGKAVVLAMVYTNCQYVCPRIIADIGRIEDAVAARFGDRVAFVAVSIDPERDTVARLKEFAVEQKLDLTRWTLLRGDADDVLELAMLLGVKYKQVATDFAHSNIITVLDTEGEIRHQQFGLGIEPDESIAAIESVCGPEKRSSEQHRH